MTSFIDGLIILLFDKVEIVGIQTVYEVKPKTKSPSEEQKILIKYLEKCKKQNFEGKNERKDTEKRYKKETDTKTD